MLSRTADSLFWMARYMERAEQMARLIDMGRRMAATPCRVNGFRNEWPAVLSAAGSSHLFFAQHDTAEHWAAIKFLMLDRDNPSSVVSCFDRARANARAARGAITVEMWQAVNDAWIEMRKLGPERLENGAMSPLIDWVKERAGYFRGATESTVLRNDGYEFLRLGLFLERIDNTARLMDVKTYMAARRGDDAAVDQYEWIALLRAAGVLRAYHAVYKTSYAPERIAEFLMLNPQCPRSLAFCAGKVRDGLGSLETLYGRREDCHEIAEALVRQVAACEVEHVLDGGLSAALSATIRYNNALSTAIAEAYHFAPRIDVDPAAADAQADDQEDREEPAAASEDAERANGAHRGANGAAEAATLAHAQFQTSQSQSIKVGARAAEGAA